MCGYNFPSHSLSVFAHVSISYTLICPGRLCSRGDDWGSFTDATRCWLSDTIELPSLNKPVSVVHTWFSVPSWRCCNYLLPFEFWCRIPRLYSSGIDLKVLRSMCFFSFSGSITYLSSYAKQEKKDYLLPFFESCCRIPAFYLLGIK